MTILYLVFQSKGGKFSSTKKINYFNHKKRKEKPRNKTTIPELNISFYAKESKMRLRFSQFKH